MNKMLLATPKHKKEAYRPWKRDRQPKGNTETLSEHAETWDSPSLQELQPNFSRKVKGNKEAFYKYVSSKGKTRESVGSALNGVRGPGDV